MFVGHFALGFAVKRYTPGVSLGVLFLAAQLADLIWPSLVPLGLERVAVRPGHTVLTPLEFLHYPYSHSLLALAVWGALLAGLYTLLQRSGVRVAIGIAALVLSHWLLDVLTHAPDMPIGLGAGPRIGLGLWNHALASIVLELLLFALGVWLYARSTRPVDRTGSIALWSLVIFLLVVYAANFLGPPPPSVTALAWSAQALWLIVAWGFWIDRHRVGTRGAVH